MSKIWKLSFVLLVCLSSNLKGQYIEQHFRGDTIPIDTAVVMDIHTYRNVRNNSDGALSIINVQKAIISDQSDLLSSKDSTITVLYRKIEDRDQSILRKDEAILNLSIQYDNLDTHTQNTYNLIQDNLKPKGFWKKPEFWIGIGFGAVGVSLIN